jgi:HTH-type transcriptional regulator / antitoxin HipB
MLIRTALDLGALIRDRRRSLGLDQQSLAERIGTNRRWVIEVERGKPRAEVGLVLKALAALGLEVAIGEPSGDASPTADIDAVIEAVRKRHR